LARRRVLAWPGTVNPVRLSRPLPPPGIPCSSAALRNVGARAILCGNRVKAGAVCCHPTYLPALWVATVTLSYLVGRGKSLRCGPDPDCDDLLVSWCQGGHRGYSYLLTPHENCPGRCLCDSVSAARSQPWCRSDYRPGVSRTALAVVASYPPAAGTPPVGGVW